MEKEIHFLATKIFKFNVKERELIMKILHRLVTFKVNKTIDLLVGIDMSHELDFGDEPKECKQMMEVPTNSFDIDFEQEFGVGDFYFLKMGPSASKKSKCLKEEEDDLGPQE